MRIAGHIDFCNEQICEGWVIDLDRPDHRMCLALVDGASVLIKFEADEYRSDLAGAGIGDGRYGFRVPVPTQNPSMERLAVKITNTRYAFPYRIGPPLVVDTARRQYCALASAGIGASVSSKKLPKCILHIGTEKTGSTSIQTFIGLNRSALSARGYFVPSTLASEVDPSIPNHVRLAILSRSEDEFHDDLRLGSQVTDLASLERYRGRVFTELCHEMQSATDGHQTMLLSNEHCHSRLITTEEVENLKSFLDCFCQTYKIVVYLRPQHELAMSQYGMLVANGVWDVDVFPQYPHPPGYVKPVTPREYFDYFHLLNRWATIFGVDAIDVRLFSDIETHSSFDVVSDFKSVLDLADINLLEPPRSNVTPSAKGLAFLSAFYRCAYNHDASLDVASYREELRAAVISCLKGPKLSAERGAIQRFVDGFEGDNETLRQKWFPELQHLFEFGLDKFVEHLPPTKLSESEFHEVRDRILGSAVLRGLLSPNDWDELWRQLVSDRV